MIYSILSGQVVSVGLGGIIGLNYSAIPVVFSIYDVELALEMFEKIQLLDRINRKFDAIRAEMAKSASIPAETKSSKRRMSKEVGLDA